MFVQGQASAELIPITLTSVDATKYTKHMDAYKKNGICYVNGYVSVETSVTLATGNNEIISGFPTPKAPTGSGLAVFSIIEQRTSKMYAGRIQNGKLNIYLTTGATGQLAANNILLINVSYPIDE